MRILDMTNQPAGGSGSRAKEWVTDPGIEAKVREIVDRVRKEGDEAVTTYTDNWIAVLSIRWDYSSRRGKSMPPAEGSRPDSGTAMKTAKRNIERFHKRQLPEILDDEEPGEEAAAARYAARTRGNLHPGRKSRVSFNGPDECHPCRNRRSEGDRHDHSLLARGKDLAGSPRGCPGVWYNGNLQDWRCTGYCSACALGRSRSGGWTRSRGRETRTSPRRSRCCTARWELMSLPGPTEVVIVADASGPSGFHRGGPDCPGGARRTRSADLYHHGCQAGGSRLCGA